MNILSSLGRFFNSIFIAQADAMKKPKRIIKTPDATIPVIIDDIKDLKDFKMTRCTYFTIENDEPSAGWLLELEGQAIPFLLIELMGVIWKPIGQETTFNSPVLIEKLFNIIEDMDGLIVDINDLWLPNIIFSNKPGKGDVYRLDKNVFTKAVLYREDRISEGKFLEFCSELLHKGNAFRFSESETLAFKEWYSLVIERTKKDYHDHPELKLRSRRH